MDIKIINLNKNKLLKTNKLTLEEQNKYFKEFLYQGLGLKIVKSDFALTNKIQDKIADNVLISINIKHLVIFFPRFSKFILFKQFIHYLIHYFNSPNALSLFISLITLGLLQSFFIFSIV